MATGAKAAGGSQLKKGATAVVELTSVAHSGMKLNLIDVTNHDSAGLWQEFIAGIKVGGQITFEGNWKKDASQTPIITDLQAGTSAAWSVLFGTTPTSTVAFTAFPVEFEISAGYDGALKFRGTLQITGQPTYS